MTRLSVFMPVLNEEASLSVAVESVLAQAADDPNLEIEVLVADGHSADNTALVVAELAKADSRVRLLWNPSVTIPAGLNACLAQSTGEYIARVDGHSEIDPLYFTRALHWLSREPELGGVGGHRVGVASTPVGRAIGLVLSSPFGIGNSINHYSRQRQLTEHASFGVYRAAAVHQVRGWDETLLVNEDVDFDYRIIAAGYNIGYEPAMVFRWHVRESLGELFKQFRRYGRGKAAMVRKNGRSAVRLRHLVPPAAVVSGLLLLSGSLIQPWLLVGTLPYLCLVSVASVLAYRRRVRQEKTSWWALPAAFATTHAAWGLGFLEGIVFKLPPAHASGRTDVRYRNLLSIPDGQRASSRGTTTAAGSDAVSIKRDRATSTPPT
jgi:glycosyltransferase involved in cell wall biosynthesis